MCIALRVPKDRSSRLGGQVRRHLRRMGRHASHGDHLVSRTHGGMHRPIVWLQAQTLANELTFNFLPQPILSSQKLITKGKEYSYLSRWLGDCMFLTTGNSAPSKGNFFSCVPFFFRWPHSLLNICATVYVFLFFMSTLRERWWFSACVRCGLVSEVPLR